MDDQTSDPPVPVSPPKPAPPVLDYGRPTPPEQRGLIRPLHPKQFAIHVGIFVGFYSLPLSGGTISLGGAILFGILVSVGWALAARAGSRWGMSKAYQAQIWIAGVIFVLGVLIILQRAGDSGETSPQYWTTYNPGFRYNPLCALRPWPIPTAALAWVVIVVLVHWLRRRVLREANAACSETPSAE